MSTNAREPNRIEPTRAADVSRERLRLWLRILKVSRFVETELRERLRLEFGSTLPRFDVLAALYRDEKGLRMSELSGVLRVSNGNVTGIVDRLVADGFIVRAPVEGDRRAMIVRLTTKGSERFAEMAAVHQSWVNELLGAVDPLEADHLITLFDSVADRFEDREEVAP